MKALSETIFGQPKLHLLKTGILLYLLLLL
jgi:hypothetical protein